MKAISLHQPWATWITMKWKTIETRTHARFACLKGQRIAIHAAKAIEVPQLFLNDYVPAMSRLECTNLMYFACRCRGNIVCTAHVDCAEWFSADMQASKDDLTKAAMTDVDGKFMLFLEDIRPLPRPVPFCGRQGIFEIPDELIPEGCR
jgi:hypothetical protein